MYDPELPAGYQDADIEQAQFEQQARQIERQRKLGNCDHGWSGPAEDGSDNRVCYHCRKVMSAEAMEAEREDFLARYL